MGWHRRGTRKYHYRSQRIGNKVRKVYFGGGPVGELAARLHALTQREQEQSRLLWERDKNCLNEALDSFLELDLGTELLRDATLLAAGFHRQGRHQWRAWYRGRNLLKQDNRADCD